MEPDWSGPFGPDDGPRETHIVREVKVRIIASIAALAGGLVFVVLWLGFLATRFPWYSNLAVVLATFLIVPALLVALWVHWGMSVGSRLARRFGGPGW